MPGLRSVVVVGAGLAGLHTARMLAARGVEVTVLEACERLGGRTWSNAIGGATFDLGGQWIGSRHRRMHALANELGIETFPTHHEGAKVLVIGDQRSTYDRTLPTIAPHKLALLQLMIWQIDRLARELPAEDPWNAPGAEELDATTVESWKRKMIPFADVRGILDAALRVIFGAEPAELSMLHFLYYVRQSGGLLPLVEVKGGLQETRFKSGAQSVCAALAMPLGGRMHLRSPVTRITQDDAGVTVFTDSGAHSADRVVVALPPTIAGRIQYEPALPPPRDELMQRYPMGATLKCHILYGDAFWRREGLSGEAVLTRGPVSVVFDNTSHDGKQPALLAFAVGRGARELGALPLPERRARVLDVLRRCFGPEALSPTHYADKDWSADRWARGCPTGFMPPSVLTTFGPALRPPISRIHWAGTETAREFTGYMEGALESAERVVAELAATD